MFFSQFPVLYTFSNLIKQCPGFSKVKLVSFPNEIFNELNLKQLKNARLLRFSQRRGNWTFNKGKLFFCLFFFFFRILLNERKKEEESEIILRENSSVDSRPDVVCRATPPISCSGSSFFAFFITKPFIVLPFSSTLSLLSLASASIFLVTLFHHRINHIWSVDESEMPGFWHHQNASSLLKKNSKTHSTPRGGQSIINYHLY